MVPPGLVNAQLKQRPNGSAAVLISGAQTTSRFLRAFGFQVLAVLLGIALAFM